jgi:hypothetical protein
VVDQLGRLGDQRLERQHHAIADEAAHVLAQNARGDQRQNGFAAVDDERMSGVMAALESCHRARALGQQIHHLALAFITPLGADDDDELSHDAYSVDEKQQHDSDEHAAQSGDAHLAIAERKYPRQGALGARGGEKRKDAFQHKEQRQRGAQVRDDACHGERPCD